MKTRMAFPWSLAVLLSGCPLLSSVDVVVESNTRWVGDICDSDLCANASTGHVLRDSGNRTFPQNVDLAGDSLARLCYWFSRRQFDTGYVRAYIVIEDPLGATRYEEHSTTPSRDIVSGCQPP